MSDFETVARPYARAIFQLAAAEDSLQNWHHSLQVAALIAGDSQMSPMFESPLILANRQADLFLSIYADIKAAPALSAELKNLITLLAENGRLAAIPAIASSFAALKQAAEGKIEVRGRSAFALTTRQQDSITANLVKRLGKAVTIIAEVDESLIAGAIIEAGDMVIDGSARGRLEKLAITLN